MFVRGVIILGGSWNKSRTRGIVIAEVLSRYFPRYSPVQPTTAPQSPAAAMAAEPQCIDVSWTNGTSDPTCSTELWASSDNVTFALLATFPLSQLTYKHHTGFYNVQRWYNLRHTNITGDGPFCATVTANSQLDIPIGNATALAVALPARPTGETRLDLTWTNGDPASPTEIYRRVSGGGFAYVTTVAAGISSYSNTGLAFATQYDFYVQHAKSGVRTAASNIASSTTYTDGPDAAPYAPSASTGDQGTIQTGWTNGDSSCSTEVQSSPDGAAWSALTTVAPGVTSYLDTFGLYATLRYYRFRHVKNSVYSDFSGTVSAVSGQDRPDAPPTGLAVSVPAMPGGETHLNLSWVNGDTTCSTEVWRSGSLIATVGPGATTFNDSGLTANTSYNYSVRHVINGLYSGYSSATATTLVDGPDAPPSGLGITDLHAGTVQLSWTNGDTTAQTEIFKNSVSQGTVSAGVTTYSTVQGNGVSASYYVRHVKNGVVYGNSNTASFTTPPVPNAPTSVSAIPVGRPQGETQLQLSWSNGEPDVGVNIYRNGVFLVTTAAGVTTYLDTGLTANTSYTYTLNHAKNYLTSPNATGSGTTLVDGPDAAPYNVAGVHNGGGAVTVSWTNGDASCSTEVYKDGSYIGSVGPGVTSLATTQGAGTTSNYTVRHTKNGIYSAFSAPGSLAVPAVPSAPTVTAVSSSVNPVVSLSLPDTGATTGIEVSVAGGAFSLATTLAAGVASWTDPTTRPNKTTVSYRAYQSHYGFTSGYSNTGSTVTPNASRYAARFGDMSGSNQVRYAYTAAFQQIYTPLTIEFWMRLSTADTARTGDAVVNHVDSGNNGGWQIRWRNPATQSPSFQLAASAFGGGFETLSVAGGFSYGAWIHVAFVIGDGSGNQVLYVNGSPVATTPLNGYQLSNTALSVGGPNSIGVVDIDELRYWRVARSQSDIQANMNTMMTPAQLTAATDLLHCWQFENVWTAAKGGKDLTTFFSPSFVTDTGL